MHWARAVTSKNAITIEQLKLACRHVEEMISAGVTENLAIRTLELFVDAYAKLRLTGNVSPHHVDQVTLWSARARAIRQALPNAKPKDHFRVEHGTPKRGFARKVLKLYRENQLSDEAMTELVALDYRLAVITIEEDASLNKKFRSVAFDTPEERWAAAGIEF